MTQYDNTNRGVMFINDRKSKDTHPDRTGTINVEGVEYFIDGWMKTSNGGKPMLSLSIKRKDKQDAPKRDAGRSPQQRQSNDYSDLNSDVPF